MKDYLISLVAIILISACAHSQDKVEFTPILVGGPCEGCEAVFEYGKKNLTAIDTLPDFHKEGQKLKVTGTVYRSDGRTPASGVIIYVYQTNPGGIYATKGDETGWGRRHGYIRGWVKTGDDGKYTFYTLKPGTYPSRTEPAHIHPTILEPDGKYYWMHSILFEGDPLLTKEHLSSKNQRGGGSSVVSLTKEGKIYMAKRDFILGKNIPGYE